MEQFFNLNESKNEGPQQAPPVQPPRPIGPSYYPQHPQKKRSAGKIILFILAGLFILGSLTLNVILFFIIIGGGFGAPSADKFHEELVSGSSYAKDTIAIIDVKGIIIDEEIFGKSVMKLMTEQLDKAGKSENVKAVILEVDSPGGSITASDILYKRILELKKRDGKKVVVLIKNLGASGAYYISAPADHIIAYPTAITGSIGVIVSTFNFKGLMEKIGLKEIVIKSGEKKDILSATREMTPEEEKIIKDIVMEMHKRFVNVVADGRKITESEVEKIADGRIFSASQALELKLIDSIGYYEDAESIARKLASISSNYKVVRYMRQKGFMESFLEGYQKMPARQVTLEDILPKDRVSFMYIWSTGY